ncbi:MAG: peptidylprolyl isomerase [Clostridia bacterium]|nr:peptidylprolyl isomerase [Clostridia bacterium]
MKKLISVLLTLMLVFSSVAAFAQVFSDIEGHWAAEEILSAHSNKIISGDGDGRFRPNDNISRAEFMKMVTAMLAEKLHTKIPDMSGEHWADKYYNFATQVYLAAIDEISYDGVSAGLMSKDNYDYPIRRWEMAYIVDNAIANIFGIRMPYEQGAIADMEQIEEKYNVLIYAAIHNVVGLGIAQGDEKGNFNAAASGTRAEAVTLVNRMATVVDEMIAYHETIMSQQQAEQEAYEKAIDDSLVTYTEIPEGHPVVKVTMENGKSFEITLYPEYAPQTCANFIKLVKDKFYDGLTFHRIVEDFVAQGGDPDGNGTGGSEGAVYGEFLSNGFKQNELKHEKGTVSMARTQHPNSATSQFFICYDAASFLDGEYAAFGKVTKGMSTVEEFLKVERTADATGEPSTPVTPIKIKKAEIIKKK